MSGATAGRRRRRIYQRKFDWLEARARHAAGETLVAIAKDYGVNPSAVQRVVKLPKAFVETATQADIERLTQPAMPSDYEPCPRCEHPKTKPAELCWSCFAETRAFAETRLERIPGEKRVVLADVAVGRIVRVEKRWGVVTRNSAALWREVDFWDGGREHISNITIVEVASSVAVLVGGIVEEPEEIAA